MKKNFLCLNSLKLKFLYTWRVLLQRQRVDLYDFKEQDTFSGYWRAAPSHDNFLSVLDGRRWWETGLIRETVSEAS